MLKKKLFSSSKEVPPSEPKKLKSSLSSSGNASQYFPSLEKPNDMNSFTRKALEIQANLNNALNKIDFCKSPICYTYNPTEYARIPNELYFFKYCQGPKKLLFIGMNPGPFGMCQTGVPFGDTKQVREWLHIEGEVLKPTKECPQRPVQGFQCTRKEQSGDRFWKFWSDQSGTADKFFHNCFVYNYCPLAFMDKEGRNVTPAEIKDCKELESVCDKFCLEVIELLQPEFIVAIGRYIEKRCQLIFKTSSVKVPIFCMPHPSPRAVNNQNWPEKARTFLDSNKLTPYLNGTQ